MINMLVLQNLFDSHLLHFLDAEKLMYLSTEHNCLVSAGIYYLVMLLIFIVFFSLSILLYSLLNFASRSLFLLAMHWVSPCASG